VPDIIARHATQGYTNSLTPRCHWAGVILLLMTRTVTRVLHSHFSCTAIQRGEITVPKSKTAAGTGRVIPLSRRVCACLSLWPERFPGAVPESFLFPAHKVGLAGNSPGTTRTRISCFFNMPSRSPSRRSNFTGNSSEEVVCRLALDCGIAPGPRAATKVSAVGVPSAEPNRSEAACDVNSSSAKPAPTSINAVTVSNIFIGQYLAGRHVSPRQMRSGKSPVRPSLVFQPCPAFRGP
jgi:hypothetical protein